MYTQKWFTCRVIHGNHIGVTLGFPTLNLEHPDILSGQKEGVYATEVKIKEKVYQGALFYGPRVMLGETHQVLEIFVFDFAGNIYGAHVSFQLGPYIRGIKKFKSFEELKIQIEKDCQKVKGVLSSNKSSPLLQ